MQADRVDAPGAELHRPANPRLNLRGNQPGLLELAHVQRRGGNRHAQRLRQLVDVHGAGGQQADHLHPQRRRKRLDDLTQALDLA